MSNVATPDDRVAEVGQHVIYTDESAVDHDALVTVVHSPACINCLYVSSDTSKQDQYGRQIERPSSVSRMSDFTAHGRYFRFKDETKKEYAAPVAR
jgi:hypothetical protein